MTNTNITITVETFNEFRTLMEDGFFDGYILRGQTAEFDNINAPTFREFMSIGTFPCDKAIALYRDRMKKRITKNEREHFLLFSHKNKIPTPLINFTKDPFNALYFACEKSTSAFSRLSDSVIYLIPENCIDVTEIIDRTESLNFLKEFAFCENDDSVLLELYSKFLSFKNEYQEAFESCFSCLREINSNIDKYLFKKKDLSDARTLELKNAEKFDANDSLLLKKYCEIFSGEEHYKKLLEISDNYGVLAYTLMLKNFLREIAFAEKPIGDMKFMPYFCYNPDFKDKASVNQENVYVFQAFSAYLPLSYSKNILTLQSISPCKTLRIKNKKTMFETLEKIGITKSFIYSDELTIASDVTGKVVADYLINSDGLI